MNYYIYLFFSVSVFLVYIGGNVASSNVPTDWFCANEECTKPISTARPNLRYYPDKPGKVSLNVRDEVKILKKPVDKSIQLWYVEVNQKLGFANLKHLMELQVIVPKDKLVKVPGAIDGNLIDALPYSTGNANVPNQNAVTKESLKSNSNIPDHPQEPNSIITSQESTAVLNNNETTTSNPSVDPENITVHRNDEVKIQETDEVPSHENSTDNVVANTESTVDKSVVPSNDLIQNASFAHDTVHPNVVEKQNVGIETDQTSDTHEQHGDSSTPNDQVPAPTDVKIDSKPNALLETTENINAKSEHNSTVPVESNVAGNLYFNQPNNETSGPQPQNAFGDPNNQITSNATHELPETPAPIITENPSDTLPVNIGSSQVKEGDQAGTSQNSEELKQFVPNVALDSMPDVPVHSEPSETQNTVTQPPPASTLNLKKTQPFVDPYAAQSTEIIDETKSAVNNLPPSPKPSIVKNVEHPEPTQIIGTWPHAEPVIQSQTKAMLTHPGYPGLNVGIRSEEQIEPSVTSPLSNEFHQTEQIPSIYSNIPPQSEHSGHKTLEEPYVKEDSVEKSEEVSNVSSTVSDPQVDENQVHGIPQEQDSSMVNTNVDYDFKNNEQSSDVPPVQPVGGQPQVENLETSSTEVFSSPADVETEEMPIETTIEKSPEDVEGSDDQYISQAPDEQTVKPDKITELPEDNVNTDWQQQDILVTNDWFSSIYSIVNSFKETFLSSEIKNEESPIIPAPPTEDKTAVEDTSEYKLKSDTPGPEEVELSSDAHCDKEEEMCNSVNSDIDDTDKYYVNIKPESPSVSFGNLDNTGAILMVIITALSVVLFSLGYYYIENSRRDGELVEKINSLERELFVIKKEQGMVDDQLTKSHDTVTQLTSKLSEQDTYITKIQEELEESKAKNITLEDNISRQEKEIEMLMENGLEMHRLLSETISDEDRSQILLSNIAELKESLTERLNENISLTEQLDKKNQEIQLLELDVKSSLDKQHDLEQKLINAHRDIEDRILQATEPLKEQIMKLEQNVAEKTSEHTRLEAELAQSKCKCETWEARCISAERGLRDAHGVHSSEAFNKWVDAAQVHADLLAATNRIDSLQQEKETLLTSVSNLEGKLDDVQKEVLSLNEKYEMAEKGKIEALTQLQVLSNYFKEKETQLQEELGLKEAQWLQKQSEGDTIYEQMRALREENLSYRTQNELLKKEILEQETCLKKQITSEELKAHENWVALRQAERRLKEVQLEASQLRNRLTALESSANHSGDGQLSPNGLEPNGESPYPGAASPPFMLFPREFMPPPPPPPLSNTTPTRPPPLGRISSPPLPVDFTPPPPLMHYDFFPPPSPPPPGAGPIPPPPVPLHKPQPRDTSHREQKESFSSNYSSESANDKPARRSKR